MPRSRRTGYPAEKSSVNTRDVDSQGWEGVDNFAISFLFLARLSESAFPIPSVRKRSADALEGYRFAAGMSAPTVHPQ